MTIMLELWESETNTCLLFQRNIASDASIEVWQINLILFIIHLSMPSGILILSLIMKTIGLNSVSKIKITCTSYPGVCFDLR